MSEKDFSRLEYRRTSGWPRRIEREWPFLQERLRQAPRTGLVVDLGCGSGEHARFLAERGYPSVGLDRSADALRLAAAGAAAAPDASSAETAWLRADLGGLPLKSGCARLALCLGNTLPIAGEDAAILAALREMRRILLPGGGLVLQLLNYHRLRRRGERWLPLNFRLQGDPDGRQDQQKSQDQEPDSELVYLRLMDFDEPEHVSFHVVTLERFAGRDEVGVRRAVRRRLRSIEFDRLEDLLRQAGFDSVELYGDYAGAPFAPLESMDVIAAAFAG